MSPGGDPNALLRQAEARFAAGDLVAARAGVERVLALVPGHPQLLQFLAVICRRAGDPAAAVRAADAAARGAPDDPRIADTLGNALTDMGRHRDALQAYDRAIAIDPGFADARLHRAATLEALGRLGEARAALRALPGVEPLVAAGALEMAAGDPAAAAAAFNGALAIDPDHPRAQVGRIKAAIERAEPDAAARLARARSRHPADRALLLEALDLFGDPATVAGMEGAVAADPAWAEGRRALALFRRERQDRADWLALHEAAVAARARDPEPWRELVGLHAAVDDWAGAAAAAERAAAALNAPEFLAAAVGHHAAAGAMPAVAQLLSQPAVAARMAPLVLAKVRLRQRDPAAAEAILARLCDESGDPEIWALRGVAWQALGDARFEWLNGQDGLVQPLDLRLDPSAQDAIAALLRQLHGDASLVLGQSVRGGTQTRGNLFNRLEPELAGLKRAIFAAVDRYRAALPPADPTHPLLRHRDAGFHMTASWSVRLTGGGFHVSHIHPKGVISSASYWALPSGEAEAARAGWLELGRPPAYLGLDGAPIRMVEPRVGHLVLFPSTLHHGTRAFGAGERITAAFDLAPRPGG